MLDWIVAQRCGPQITQMDKDSITASHFNAEAHFANFQKRWLCESWRWMILAIFAMPLCDELR